MAGVMEAIVGPWGRLFVSIGLVISIAGNYLSWSLLAAEVLHSAARNDTMPAFLAAENNKAVPYRALWLTNIVIQLFLLVTWFADQAFTVALKMTSAMTLIPYLLVAAYAFKLAWTGEGYNPDIPGRRGDGVRGALATVYAGAMLVAGGPKFLLLSALLYTPGTSLYVYARRERGARVFSVAEALVFATLAVAAIAALSALASGAIAI
jgi:arginine:ornithine antiporter/lysine permease